MGGGAVFVRIGVDDCEEAVPGRGGEMRSDCELDRVVAGRGNSGMEKSPTRCGRVGCRGSPPGRGYESIVAAVPGLEGVREIFVSDRPRGLVFLRERLESVDISVLVRVKYGLILPTVSCLDNNPLLDSLVSLRDKGYNGMEMILSPSPSSSTLGNVGCDFPLSEGVAAPNSLCFSILNVSFLRRLLSAKICVIRLSTL